MRKLRKHFANIAYFGEVCNVGGAIILNLMDYDMRKLRKYFANIADFGEVCDVCGAIILNHMD